ncbi:unnamed protein product, partial [Bubo scandiacus]
LPCVLPFTGKSQFEKGCSVSAVATYIHDQVSTITRDRVTCRLYPTDPHSSQSVQNPLWQDGGEHCYGD